jgi:hypothetical protein
VITAIFFPLYYTNGWRMVKDAPFAKLRVTEIRSSDVTDLVIPGSASNVNNARHTVRPLLHLHLATEAALN